MKALTKIILFLFVGSSKLLCQQVAILPDCRLLNEIYALHKESLWGKAIGPSASFDSLDLVRFKELDLKLDTMLAAVNYSNQVNKYLLGRYYLQQGDKKKAARIFKEVMRFNFWTKNYNYYMDGYKDRKFPTGFYEIYRKAGFYLIEALKGNLEELNKLEFVLASHADLMWKLKMEIENAGGTWTRGSTDFYINTPLKHLRLPNDKHPRTKN